MSLGARLREVNEPSTKQPFKSCELVAMLCKAVSRATLSLGAVVLIIVDHLASIGRL